MSAAHPTYLIMIMKAISGIKVCFSRSQIFEFFLFLLSSLQRAHSHYPTTPVISAPRPAFPLPPSPPPSALSQPALRCCLVSLLASPFSNFFGFSFEQPHLSLRMPSCLEIRLTPLFGAFLNHSSSLSHGLVPYLFALSTFSSQIFFPARFPFLRFKQPPSLHFPNLATMLFASQ